MGKSPVDFGFSTEIFRNDRKQVLAINRHQATILGVRLKYEATGYAAGEVVCRNGSTGLYEKYSAASGSLDAVAVLFGQVRAEDQPATGGALAQGIFGGKVYKDRLVGYDSGAKSDLVAQEVVDSVGDTIVSF